MATSKKMLLVTSLSGAGRSTFLRSLEDVGYHCMDHVPVELVPQVVESLLSNESSSVMQDIVLGVDVRSSDVARDFVSLQEVLKSKYAVKSIFVHADREIVLRRYSETRRKHPLLNDGSRSLKEAIADEERILKSVKTVSDIIIDTSNWSPHNLARYAEMHFAKISDKRSLAINVISFGFKKGVVRPVDCLFDVRFLSNPYFVPSLRDYCGLDEPIKAYLQQDEKWLAIKDKITDFVLTSIPYYYEEGKHYLHIGIGCTGGHHRSVFCAEYLAEHLRAIQDIPISVSVEHRDLKNL